MGYETIIVKEITGGISVIFNRLEHQNSINELFLKELNNALDLAEKEPSCRILVLEGQEGIFCTGMDFNEAALAYENADSNSSQATGVENFISSFYMETIKRFSLSPKIIISKVDGKVMAGGVGLAAASDLVIATPRSQFSLSEALWGLLPACVIPYLIRRVGYQKAYKMTLTTLAVSAQEAYDMNLVDELSENPDDSIRRFWLRIGKLEEATISNVKQYFRKMWFVTDQMEEVAVSEISRLVAHPKVRDNIENFVKYQKFPWEN